MHAREANRATDDGTGCACIARRRHHRFANDVAGCVYVRAAHFVAVHIFRIFATCVAVSATINLHPWHCLQAARRPELTASILPCHLKCLRHGIASPCCTVEHANDIGEPATPAGLPSAARCIHEWGTVIQQFHFQDFLVRGNCNGPAATPCAGDGL